MSDRWFSEIELQKTYSLSPRESFCVIGARNGMTSKQIAESEGVSVSTVNTMLRRARDKMKEIDKNQVLIVEIGNKDVPGHAVKQRAMQVLFEFLSMNGVLKYKDAGYWFVAYGFDTSKVGNSKWMLEKVFRYVDIYSTTGDADSKKRAEKINDKFHSENPPENVLGTGIVKYFLEEMYMRYKCVDLDE